MKRSKRVDAARSKAAPATGSWTQTASERIMPLAQTAAGMAVPLAQTAAGKVVPLAQTAAAMAVPMAQNAAAKAGPLAQSAAAAAVPLAQSAVAKAGPLAQTAAAAAVPLATHAVTRVSPYAHTVADAVSPYAHAVAGRVGPYTTKATIRLSPLAAGGAAAAQGAVDRVGPVLGEAYGRVETAYGRVGPALGSAKERVADELLPKVSTTLGAAAGSPLAMEAVRRGRATLAAARGELTLPEPPRRRGRWLKRVAVVTAAAGVVAVVVSKVLGGSDTKGSGWQAARPSAPAGGSPSAPAGVGAEPGLQGAEQPDQAATTSGSAVAQGYGEGSYVGDEPPEGFVIKGNRNSMKYHLPDGSGYFETKAEVWFATEEAAKAAGFLPVQE